MNERITLTAGSRLRIGSPKVGLHTYVAVSGGIAVDYVLGSRSTDTTSTIGPHPLEKGRILPVGDARPSSPVMDQTELLRTTDDDIDSDRRGPARPRCRPALQGIDDLTGTRTGRLARCRVGPGAYASPAMRTTPRAASTEMYERG